MVRRLFNEGSEDQEGFKASIHTNWLVILVSTRWYFFQYFKGKTPNIATEFAEIVEIAMVFLKIAISLRKKKHGPPRA